MSAGITLPRPRSRRRVALQADAVITGANGLAYVAAAGPLGDLLGLAPSVLRGAGAFLVVFAAAVWRVSAAPRIRSSAVKAIVVVNVLWTLASLLAAIGGWGSPSTAGTVWIVLQGLVVASFAGLQLVALKPAAATDETYPA